MRVLLIFLLLPAVSFAQQDCQLKAEKDSIQVYVCAPGKSKFKIIRSTFSLQAKPSEAAAMIFDVPGMGAWQYKTVNAYLVRRISDHEIIYYTEVEAPVLTDNRDFVIRLTWSQDPNTGTLTIVAESLPDHLPAKSGVVRVPFSHAVWTITRAGNGRLAVDYHIDIDVGGQLKPWMLSLVSHQASLETFSAMRQKIATYKGKGMRGVKD